MVLTIKWKLIMSNFRTKVEQNPVKYYSWLIFSFTLFFIGLILIVGTTTIISFNQLVESFFNSANMSVVSSIASNPSSGQIINMNFLASMITLFGGFGGFCYVFFSIRDGKFSNKDELVYSFEGFLIIILFLDALLFASIISGKWYAPKITELIFLLALPIFAIIFSFFFKIVFSSIEENYNQRISIIKFLEKSDDKIVISPIFDTTVRDLIRNFESYTFYIFLLLVGMIFLGIFQDFNPLTIISSILFSLIILIGYSRLITLKTPTSNIKLISRVSPKISASDSFNEDFSNIFIVSESADFITILSNKQEDKKIQSFSKNCICSIQDNWYEIYEEKKHPIALWYLTRTIRSTLTILAFYVVFLVLKTFIPTKESWILFFVVLIVSIIVSIYAIHRLKTIIDSTIEKGLDFLIYHLQ
jgi:hypothetical protein